MSLSIKRRNPTQHHIDNEEKKSSTHVRHRPIRLLQVSNVLTDQLQPYAPAASVTMGQYAVTCVMQWAQAQGYPGAIPTWEIGDGCWGVVIFQANAGLSQVNIPIADLPGTFDPTNTISWGALVQTWATSNGNQLAIPTFVTDGTNVGALVFGESYPKLSFYDAPNRQLYLSMTQPNTLCNLQDPAVWANSVMRVANNIGYGAGWPTWQWTTFRGLIGIPTFDYGPLPNPTSENVEHAIKILKNTVTTLQLATANSLADYAGIYGTFTAPPIEDEGMQILMDCIFGAIQIGLNLIPDVGGALASLVGAAITVAQDAATKSVGDGGSYTLLQYQTALQHASDATINHIARLHDKLSHARASHAKLEKVWTEFYIDPLSGRNTQLGMLALASKRISNLHHWTTMGDKITSELNNNLMASISMQLYTLQYRTYPNRAPEKQWWDGTVSEVEAPGGKIANYIDGPDADADDLSVWFSDLTQVDDYVTATEWWLQAANTTDEYPPTSMVYSLFSSDGFGTTTNWVGPFSKQIAYTQWFWNVQELAGTYTQAWAYPASGNIVTATVSDNDDFGGGVWSLVAGYSDDYGNLYLSSDSRVAEFNSYSGYGQPVTKNYLSPL